MSLFHAVVYIDHHSAQVLRFSAQQVLRSNLHSHEHYTRQHGSVVRSEHEFFGSVSDELADIAEVLVTGGHTSLADFRHYIEKHRPEVQAHIVGYQVVASPTPNELVALAREQFIKHDQMTGVQVPL